MRQSVTRLVILLWVALGVCWPLPVLVRAQTAPAAKGETDAPTDQRSVIMDFQDVDIAVLAKLIGEMTGKNFIVDEKVRGKVTVISPTKLSVDEAYGVFQSALQVKGFTTVPAGAVIKIVPTKDAKSSSIRTFVPPE